MSARSRAPGSPGARGAVVGVPAIVGLPLGLWLSVRFGYGPVFVLGAALPLITLALVAGLPVRRGPVERRTGMLGGFRDRGLARPVVIFAAVTLAAGKYGDRRGPVLLVPAVLAAAAGMTGLVWLHDPYALVAGAALFGAGFGAAQNLTLTMMFERAPESEFGKVSALWNLAYDGGMGIGAAGFGLVAGLVGYPAGFALTAAVLFTALIPTWLDLKSRPTRKTEES